MIGGTGGVGSGVAVSSGGTSFRSSGGTKRLRVGEYAVRYGPEWQPVKLTVKTTAESVQTVQSGRNMRSV